MVMENLKKSQKFGKVFQGLETIQNSGKLCDILEKSWKSEKGHVVAVSPLILN